MHMNSTRFVFYHAHGYVQNVPQLQSLYFIMRARLCPKCTPSPLALFYHTNTAMSKMHLKCTRFILSRAHCYVQNAHKLHSLYLSRARGYVQNAPQAHSRYFITRARLCPKCTSNPLALFYHARAVISKMHLKSTRVILSYAGGYVQNAFQIQSLYFITHAPLCPKYT